MKSRFSILFALSTFLSFAQPNTDVFLLDLNTEKDGFKLSNFQNISNNEGYDNQPSFMDNETILYAGTRNAQTDIVKYNLNYGSKTWICFTEGGEYSPLKIPNQNAVSAIRLDPDGKQRLYRYDLKNSTNTVILDTLVVGYHLWFDNNTVISSVLEADYLSLYTSDLKTGLNKKITTHVGRSLHHIPNSNLISFISKNTDGTSEIKSLNPKTGVIKTIAPTLSGVEDMCWLADGSILMAKDEALFKLNPKNKSGWIEITSLKSYGINNLSRLTVSPDGNKLAIVGELTTSATNTLMNTSAILEPKLENIKWIAGNWKGEAFGGQTEENWSEPSAGSMMATFKLVDNDKVVFYEIIIIREIENTLILQLKHFGSDLKGWEEKEKTIDFPLKEITENKVVFEGMIFEKISANEMNIYVDIKQDNGSVETVKFNYKK
ncbi:DUF6265 family protein [Gelidibacter pelagius]|uniref:DUF6265 domain-containing protein n=1 Tax=Gelidibacter pelagius TaxID=2819985 RepID=A0ABS3SSZ2_9FLAO|nr:DUF6265 family protein [Gelidibacter pelagius]MBO3098837.1 hypothetical protein [Gelidibacter pelagius]